MADLTLSTAVTPDPVEPGETFVMALTVTNTDGFDRSDVVLTMRYPEGLRALSDAYISDGGDCPSIACEANEFVTWSLGVLKAGEGKTLTLPPAVAETASEGAEIDFSSIEVTDSSGATASASRSLSVVSDRVLELALHEAVDPARPGGELTYLLSYGHSKASAQADAAELELVLPSGVAFVSASGDGVLDGDRVRWALGALDPGQSGQARVVVEVDTDVPLGTALQARGVLTASGLPESVIEESTRVEAEEPLRLAVEAAPDPAEPGERTRLALTVSNTSDFARSDVSLVLRYPPYLRALGDSFISDGGDCPSISCETSEWVSWGLGELQAGTGITVTLPPLVLDAAPRGALISLLPLVRDSSGRTVEAGRTLLVGERGLELAVAEALDPVPPGDTLRLQLSASNSTPSTSATGLRLEFPLPDGAAFSSASGGGLLQEGLVAWDLGRLDAGEVAQRTLELAVDATAAPGDLLVSQARLTGAGQTEVRDDMVSRVEAETPLRLAIEVLDPSESAQPGDTLDAWLTIDSLSAFARSDVRLSLRYPRYLRSLSDSFVGAGGDCPSIACEVDEWVTWHFDTLAAGGSEDVDLPPEVSGDTLPGSLIFFDAVVADSTARSRAEAIFPVGTVVDTPAPTDAFRLQVAVSGSGTVTSVPSGILCPGACAADFLAGTSVTLTAQPGAGASFVGWGGDCAGSDPTCTLAMSAAQSLTASFQGGDTPTERDTPWKVAEIYIATMGYAPDNDGLQYWVEQIQTVAAWTPDTVAQSFFDQPLVQAQYPESVGFGPFIDALYRNIFGRGADTQGYDYWLGELQSGRVSRDQMIIALINGGWANPSPEAQEDMQRFGNRVQVGLAFAAYQAENGIRYNQLSFADQAALRQAGYDVLLGVTADTATRDAAIASIPDLLGAFPD